MAGHSKFKNIMHRKGAQDKKRAKVFTKVGREITVAVKTGGDPTPENNPRLRAAIQAARAVNMPKDRIDRAIKSAMGGGDGADYTETRYEGRGPGGSAIIVDCLTDNKNRTVSDLRTAFSKNGGQLGDSGSVAFNFERMGRIEFPLSVGDEDTVTEAAIEAGADEVETGEDMHEIYCAPDDFADVRNALEEALGEATQGSLVWKPTLVVDLDEDKARTMLKLIDVLEDNDDVQVVSTNFEASDDVMEKLAAEE